MAFHLIFTICFTCIYCLELYMHRRIYYEANEASASGPRHLGGPHQNFNAVSKADLFIA